MASRGATASPEPIAGGSVANGAEWCGAAEPWTTRLVMADALGCFKATTEVLP